MKSFYALTMLAMATLVHEVVGDSHAFRQLALEASPRPYCYVEDGFDYVGYDLTSKPGPVESCCEQCSTTPNCKTWSWSNHNGGTCWLKYGRGEIVVNRDVKSAVFFWSTHYLCQLNEDMDYEGNDLDRVSSVTAEGCCDICHNYLGCRAYAWSNYLGGSCWLKSKAGKAIYKPGVRSAEAYPDINEGCVNVEIGVDYVDNDIANRPSQYASGCCTHCRVVEGCRAYSWTNHSGGTCWLKSTKGSTILKDGVISSTLFPMPQCSLEDSVDYVGNDIANFPSGYSRGCCSICNDYPGCKAFTWADGTCWLKSAKGPVIPKSGARSGTV